MKIAHSSNISEMSYDSKQFILTVEFILKSKSQEYVYVFSDVPKEIWDSFKTANKKKESIGKLFAATIKDKFKFEKVKKTSLIKNKDRKKKNKSNLF